MPYLIFKGALRLRPVAKLTLLSLTVININAFAEDNQKEDLPTMVISAARHPEAKEKLGSSISVVDSEELQERNDLVLSDSLRSVPGIQVTQSGGPGKTTSLFLRGASAAQTLILVDGIPVNDSLSGQYDFADFSTLSVDQIEVVKGSQSLMYGSDAMGGLVNIVTSKPSEEAGLLASIGGGNYGYQKYSVKGDTGGKNIKANIYGSFTSLDGISTATFSEVNKEDDAYANITVGSKAEANIDDIIISPSIRYTKARSNLDGFEFTTGPTDALDYIQNRESVQSSLKVEREGDTFNPSLILGLTNDAYDANDPLTSFNNYDFSSRTITSQLQNVFTISEQANLLTGYSYERNDGKNIGAFDKSRDINSIFTNLILKPIDGSDLGAGIRYDHNSSFGEAVTYRTTLSQAIEPLKSRLHSSIGTGFRAPTLSDLYFPGFSNENLKAEKSTSYDLGLETKFGFLTTDLTAFYTRFKDLIAFNTETFLPENLKRAETYGIEGSINIDISDYFQPSLTYTYLESEDKDTNQALARRARHQGGASIKSIPHEKVLTRIDTFYMADRIDSTGLDMDDYIIVNASAHYELTENIKPFIKAQNILDNDYEENPGYGTFGAFYYVGIELRL